MSRRWFRATLDTYCGSCGNVIAKGQPVFELATPSWKKRRCQVCAGEPLPAEVPELPPTTSGITPRILIPTGPGTLPLDWKQKQTGDAS